MDALRRPVIVRYSPRAVRDLESIREYLSARSARGAVAVLAAIYAAVEFIRRNPEAAEATSISNVRGKIVGRFRFKIFYRVVEAEGAIDIVHVRHTSRRAWLGQDE